MNVIVLTVDHLPSYSPYQTAKESGQVETGIIPLCDALIPLGAKPISSCEGHAVSNIKASSKGKGFFVSLFQIERFNWDRPYVVFSATLETAAAIHDAIQAIPKLTEFGYLHRKSYFVWDVEGHFINGSKLVWTITTNDSRLSSGSTWVEGDINQTVILLRNDIIAIAQILEGLVNRR